VKALIAKGADVNAKDNIGRTALLQKIKDRTRSFNYSSGEVGDAREKMNKEFFLGLHSLFLSLKQRHQIIFNYSGKFVFSTFDYRLAYGRRGKPQRPGNFST